MLEDGLGYIKIDSFDSNTFNEFSGQFRQMEMAGLSKGLILDLRDNPGGLVDQAVEVAKMLVPEGEIVRLVGRDGVVQNIYYSSARKTLQDGGADQ
jgi:carboxyl-terminal processing protease